MQLDVADFSAIQDKFNHVLCNVPPPPPRPASGVLGGDKEEWGQHKSTKMSFILGTDRWPPLLETHIAEDSCDGILRIVSVCLRHWFGKVFTAFPGL